MPLEDSELCLPVAGTSEEIYKILRQSSVDKQHMNCDDTYTYHMYRPYCVDGLMVFTIGNNAQRNPAVEDDVVAVMVGGVVEAPVAQGAGGEPTPGMPVFCSWNPALAGGARAYLTTDPNDNYIQCCWGVIIDDQYPIHYGETPLTGTYATLHSVKILQPTCADIAAESGR